LFNGFKKLEIFISNGKTPSSETIGIQAITFSGTINKKNTPNLVLNKVYQTITA
jgi:hypothetical protein